MYPPLRVFRTQTSHSFTKTEQVVAGCERTEEVDGALVLADVEGKVEGGIRRQFLPRLLQLLPAIRVDHSTPWRPLHPVFQEPPIQTYQVGFSLELNYRWYSAASRWNRRWLFFSVRSSGKV